MHSPLRLSCLWLSLVAVACAAACQYPNPLEGLCIDPTDTGKHCIPDKNPDPFYYNVAIKAGATSARQPFSPDPAAAGAESTSIYPFRWMNFDGVVHHLVSDTPAFDTGDIAPGAVVNIRFTKQGTFQYRCTIHPTMTGTITITR